MAEPPPRELDPDGGPGIDGCPMEVITYDRQPELWDTIEHLDREVWPEYNRHGDVLNRYWGGLYTRFASWQLVLHDEDSGMPLAEGNTIPIVWDGTVERLPEGIDGAVELGFALAEADRRPNTLCALAAAVVPAHRDRRLGGEVILAMRRLAARRGLSDLLAPLRPSLKHRYPTVPIEEYVGWIRSDGLPFDPWVRLHVRLDADILAVAPRSLKITGSVADWESWTGVEFTESGSFLFPDGLAPVEIDLEADLGTYWEPNIWVRHAIDRRL